MIKITSCLLLSILLSFSIKAQDSLFRQLKIDSTYCNINFYSNKTAQQFYNLFNTTQKEKLVVFHYGGSHIQAEMPTTVVREKLAQLFGDGGRGMIFPYNIANTYSSVNYSIKYTGKWKYGKSFQFPAPIKLGVCGMAVQTKDTLSQLLFKFKSRILNQDYQLKLLLDIDSLTPEFILRIDTSVFNIDKKLITENKGKDFLSVNYSGSVDEIEIKIKSKDTLFQFSFYGIDVETKQQTGVVYHSLGVGAAPFRSVLNIENLESHSEILKPDIVFLDFGTNDILFKNSIDKQLSHQIEKSIERFRKINPEIIIVLTSTQDLFYKKKFITSAISFRNLIDSLAKKNDCMFWNWYDLSGGFGTIKIWNNLGYAKKDGIHLTHDGYRIKGQFLFQSITNTLNEIKNNPQINLYHSGLKSYDTSDSKTSVVSTENYHRVRSGETLIQIAKKYNLSVEILKEWNQLTSDTIKPGEAIKISK